MAYSSLYLGMAIASSALQPFLAQSPLVPVVLEMRVDGTAPVVVSALRSGDDAFIPLVPVLRLVQIPYTESAGVTVVRVDGHAITVDTGAQIVRRDSVWYVTASRLATLLHSTIRVDWAELAVTLSDDTLLPIAQWRRRTARWRALRRVPSERMPTDTHVVVRSRMPHGAALSYTMAIQQLGHASTYTMLFGSAVLGGVLSASAAVGGHLEQLAWHTAWSSHTVLRQMTVGTIPAMGWSSTSLRGITLSNVPILRDLVYDTLQIAGVTGPAWEVELTRNGETMAVDSAALDGHYAFRVPATYGATRMTVIAYGPAGEVQQSDHFVMVPNELLPPHTFYYSVSVGICTTPSCRYGLTSTLQISPTAWSTLSADVSTVAPHPLARLAATTRFGNAVHLLGEHIPSQSSALSLWYTPSPQSAASVSYRSTLALPRAPPVRAGRRSALLYSLRWAPDVHPSSRWTLPPLTIDGVSTREPSGFATTDIRIASVLQGRLGQLTPFVHRVYQPIMYDATQWRTTSGVDAWLFPNAAWRTSPLGFMLDVATLRVHVEGRHASHMRVTGMSLSTTLPKLGRVEAQLSAPIGVTRPVFGISFGRRTAFATIRSLLSTTRGESPHVTHDIDGTILFDPSIRHLTTSTMPMGNDGGVTGTVFFDTNGNGIRDPGEPHIADADVRIGDRTVQSDSAGRYHLWGLTPFMPIAIQLDPSSLQEPDWQPTYGVLSLDVMPTLYTNVDIPVTHVPALTTPR